MRPYELPAMVNAHSHAFQRDLRGAAERPAPEAHSADDFWSWREAMYALARSHAPDSMRTVAARVFAEMAAAGYGAVGEFHYVHPRPDGTPYEDPNAMAIALATASHTDGVAFDDRVLAAMGDLPELVCFAGHDAGIVAPRVPAGMVFVRNATGVSHAPDEHVELDDAAVAAAAMLGALERLAAGGPPDGGPT